MEGDVKNVRKWCVSVRVLAYSNVFRSKHPTLFIKGETSKPIYIVVRNSKSLEWIRSLEVGRFYRFTELIPSLLWKGTADEIKVLEASLSSEVRKMKIDSQNPLNDSHSKPASYVGKVSGKDYSKFGLIELEEGSVLCTSFVKQYMYLPNLQPSDKINLFNTHSKIVNGKTYFIMCGVSQLFSENEFRKDEPMHSLVDFCATRNFGFEDFLKAVSLFIKLEKLLEDLSSTLYETVLSEHVTEVMESVYPGILDKKDKTSSKDVYKEFLLTSHHCRPMKKGYLEELEVLLPDEFHHLPAPLEDSGILWNYKLLQRVGGDILGDKNVVLVGKLEVDLKTGYLSLSGGCKIYCVIPEDKDFRTQTEKFVGKLVVIKGAYQVFERFMIHSRNEGQLEERKLNYILLYPGSIHPIVNDKGLEDVIRKGVFCESNASRMMENKTSADELMDVDDDEYLSQRFVLHHASSPVILESRVMFFALTSLIRSSDASSEEDLFSSWRMLCMQGSMLQYFPFLCENRIYEIRYHKSHGAHYFDKSSSVPEFGTVKKILPYVQNGVFIPKNSFLIGPFESPHLPLDSVVNKEIYGVNDALLHASVNDVIHIKGILLIRSHQTPKYQNYISNCGLGCGVPAVCHPRNSSSEF